MESNKQMKKNIFTTPDGYFEQLQRDIALATVESSNTGNAAPKQSKRRTLYVTWGRIAGYAAAVAMVAIVALTTGRLTGNTIQDIQANEDSNDFIEELLDSYPIDDYTFYCYLTESNNK